MLEMHQYFQETLEANFFSGEGITHQKRGDSKRSKARDSSSQEKQCFIKMAFIPEASFHLSLSQFLTGGEKNDLYPQETSLHSLSMPIAILDRGGEKTAVAQLADSFRERLTFSNPIESQEIQGFLPVSDLYSDLSTGFIVAILKDDSFFQACNKAVIDLVTEESDQLKVSCWPEFHPSCYRPFMTVGRVNQGPRDQKQIAEMLTERLRLNPLSLTFKTFFCEPFYFDFNKYFANVDLEACVWPSKNIFSIIY